jgi:hypothetical protein
VRACVCLSERRCVFTLPCVSLFTWACVCACMDMNELLFGCVLVFT